MNGRRSGHDLSVVDIIDTPSVPVMSTLRFVPPRVDGQPTSANPSVTECTGRLKGCVSNL